VFIGRENISLSGGFMALHSAVAMDRLTEAANSPQYVTVLMLRRYDRVAHSSLYKVHDEQ
jgi:hypothetical protein